ncbi:MAG: heavy-metal-associated domain-containing protein [Balneolaceae bacterium]|nr:heavy-metal-associated domain-containing protein [Balneolaceae bacterium]
MEKRTTENHTYRVKGMGCEACADTVRNALENVEGVESAVVSLEEKTARVRVEPGRVTESELTRSVEESGYELVVSG